METDKLTLEKSCKNIYQDLLKVKADLSKDDLLREKTPQSGTIVSSLALNTLMRHMMDMVRSSNEVISNLSSKVRSQESTIKSIQDDLKKCQDEMASNTAKIISFNDDVTDLKSKQNLNELSIHSLCT